MFYLIIKIIKALLSRKYVGKFLQSLAKEKLKDKQSWIWLTSIYIGMVN